MDPPVSVPRAKGTSPAEVAAAGPTVKKLTHSLTHSLTHGLISQQAAAQSIRQKHSLMAKQEGFQTTYVCLEQQSLLSSGQAQHHSHTC